MIPTTGPLQIILVKMSLASDYVSNAAVVQQHAQPGTLLDLACVNSTYFLNGERTNRSG